MAEWLIPSDWSELVALGAPLLDSVLRGVLVYAGLVLLLRVLPRRQVGSLSLTDLLLANLVIEAVSNGLQGENRTVTSGLISAATVLLCAFAVDWLASRWSWARKLLQADPVPLVRDGRLNNANLERQMITRDELESQARLQGLEGAHQIKDATMEPEGEISIVPRKQGEQTPPPRRKRRCGREETLERLWALQRQLAAQQAKIEAALQEMMLQAQK